MPYKDKNKQKEYQRMWVKKNRDKQNEYVRKLRRHALEKLGGPKCIYCGCDEYSMLEINHKNGGGGSEKRARKKSFYLAIKSGKRSLDDLEVTCIVCNARHNAKILKGAKGDWKVIWKK